MESSAATAASRLVASWNGDAVRVLVCHNDPVAQHATPALDWVLGAEGVDRLCWVVWEDLRRISRGFDATIAASDWMAERLVDHGLQRPRAVPFGINRELFSPSLRDEGVRRSLLTSCGSPADAKLLVTISRHSPDKRIPMLVSAFELASRRMPLALVIYGDGVLRPLVERRAKRIDNVRLAGFDSDHTRLARVLASADALLHGGAGETFGLVVAEAICSGTPAVVPDRGGARELVLPACSEVYASGDHHACADAIVRLLGRDAAALRAACRDAARRVVDWREHFDRLFAFYAELSAERAQDRATCPAACLD